MSDFSAASYKPDMQVLTLSRAFAAFANPEDPAGFTTPEQVAIFTHEWVHYLHNLSTMVGMTTICTYSNIWNSFRWTFRKDGWSDPAALPEPNWAQDIEVQFDYIRVLRSPNAASLPPDSDPDRTRVIRARLERATTLPQFHVHLIRLTLEYRRHADAELEEHKATIGTHEILEYAAFALEDLAAIRLRGSAGIRAKNSQFRNK